MVTKYQGVFTSYVHRVFCYSELSKVLEYPQFLPNSGLQTLAKATDPIAEGFRVSGIGRESGAQMIVDELSWPLKEIFHGHRWLTPLCINKLL